MQNGLVNKFSVKEYNEIFLKLASNIDSLLGKSYLSYGSHKNCNAHCYIYLKFVVLVYVI